MGRWGYFGYFKPSRPRAAKGGIRAQSKGGKFGESWWAKRWISVLESFNIGARLGRGRSYARSGQVLSIETDKGRVRAKVQGSRPKPYEVAIEVMALSSADWQKVAPLPEEEEISPSGEPLAADIPAFWDGHKLPEPLFGEVRIPPVPAALPKRLGNFPFWRGEIKFLEAMEAIYPRVAAYGLDLFLGTYSSGPMEKENLAEKSENTFLKKRKGRISPL